MKYFVAFESMECCRLALAKLSFQSRMRSHCVNVSNILVTCRKASTNELEACIKEALVGFKVPMGDWRSLHAGLDNGIKDDEGA